MHRDQRLKRGQSSNYLILALSTSGAPGDQVSPDNLALVSCAANVSASLGATTKLDARYLAPEWILECLPNQCLPHVGCLLFGGGIDIATLTCAIAAIFRDFVVGFKVFVAQINNLDIIVTVLFRSVSALEFFVGICAWCTGATWSVELCGVNWDLSGG